MSNTQQQVLCPTEINGKHLLHSGVIGLDPGNINKSLSICLKPVIFTSKITIQAITG